MTVRKIDLMHEMFGEISGKKCGECSNLVMHRYENTYYKCRCYGLSSSEATDFRKKWTACGLFNKEYNGNPIVKMVTREKKPDEQIEGQVSIFEYGR